MATATTTIGQKQHYNNDELALLASPTVCYPMQMHILHPICYHRSRGGSEGKQIGGSMKTVVIVTVMNNNHCCQCCLFEIPTEL